MKNILSNKKSGWKLATLIFVFAVVASLYFSLTWWPLYFAPEMRAERAYMEASKRVLAERERDTYGSTTPQGTLDLFTSALEKGDTDLASKYFMVYKQDEMRRELEAGEKSGGIRTYLELIKKANKDDFSSMEGYYTFEFSDTSDKPPFSVNLTLDPISHLWKLESL